MTNKSTISGKNITITSKNIKNNGNIHAKENLHLQSLDGDISNGGNIKTNDLNVDAQETFRNDGDFIVNNYGLVTAKKIEIEKDFTGTGTVEERIRK